MSVLSLQPPISESYQGVLDESGVYDDLGLIPCRGTLGYSSHAYLELLGDMAELSEDHGTCINDIVTMGFKGDIALEKKAKKGLKRREDKDYSLSEEDESTFCELLESVGVDLCMISELSCQLVRHHKIYGNAYLKLREININGVVKYFFEIIDPKHIAYIKKKDSQDPDTFFVSKNSLFGFESRKSFSDFIQDSDRRNYKLIRKYPAFSERLNVRETIFHLKDNGNGHYGMPDTVHTLRSQWVNFAQTDLSSKIAGSEFVAKKVIVAKQKSQSKTESKKKDREGLKQFSVDLKKLSTNDGAEAKSLVVISPPPNIESLDFEDLEVNRDTESFKAHHDKAQKAIYAAHGVDRQLTGAADIKSSLGGNMLHNMLLKYDYKVIRPYQERISNFLLDVQKVISTTLNQPIIHNTRLIFPRTAATMRSEIVMSEQKEKTNEEDDK